MCISTCRSTCMWRCTCIRQCIWKRTCTFKCKAWTDLNYVSVCMYACMQLYMHVYVHRVMHAWVLCNSCRCRAAFFQQAACARAGTRFLTGHTDTVLTVAMKGNIVINSAVMRTSPCQYSHWQSWPLVWICSDPWTIANYSMLQTLMSSFYHR